MKTSHRYIRNLIHRYDGATVNLETLQMSWQSRRAALSGLTDREGLERREAAWYREQAAARHVEFDPTRKTAMREER